MTDVCQAAQDLIKRNEGLRLHAYTDSVGIWTIGYGHTPAAPSMVWTLQEANEAFAEDIAKFADGVDDLLSEDVDTTENQFGAMVSLAYNVGLHNFEKSSVRRLHNVRRYVDAANAFLLWNKAGGEVLSGLDRRRHEERELYLTP